MTCVIGSDKTNEKGWIFVARVSIEQIKKIEIKRSIGAQKYNDFDVKSLEEALVCGVV